LFLGLLVTGFEALAVDVKDVERRRMLDIARADEQEAVGESLRQWLRELR
jgi:hypothetical protein